MNKTSFKMKKGPIVLTIIMSVVVAVMIAVTILANSLLEPILSTVLGGPSPIKGDNYLEIYKSDYKSKAEATAAGRELNVKIAEEGFVLLLNEDNALPITKKNAKISVFGKNSSNLVLGGSGSGGLGDVKASTIYDALEKGGFEYNPELKKFYENDKESGSGRSDNPALSDTSSKAPTLDIGETPVQNYSYELKSSFKNYDDAAIVVISRVGGESFDLPRSQNVAAGGIESNHYLQLDSNEYALLDMVTDTFDKVIVVLNTLTSFQCDFIYEYNNTESDKRIDAMIWVGGPGVNGIEALGGILNGSVNPSAKTTDVYSRDFTKDPTWVNFGDGSQTNEGKNNTSYLENGSAVSGYNIVTYEEGVYTGYRYYETRGVEESAKDASSDWYKENVIFPFGYGLSYTNFEQSITSVSGSLKKGEKLRITVKSENVGSVAGKDVVQLYVGKPYYYGGIEKSFVELVDFAKTDLLQSGKSEEITFEIDPYYLASYDYNDANDNGFSGYELEKGEYTFYISSDSHVIENAYDKKSVVLDTDYRFENDSRTGVNVENLYTTDDYDDAQYRLSDVTIKTALKDVIRKGMSRTDFEGTFPTALTEEEREVISDVKNGKTELQALQSFEHNNTEIAKSESIPATGKNVEGKEYTLRDLLNEDNKVDYDNEKWDILLDRITFQEMKNLVNNGAFQTTAIPSIGKNLTNDSDGPIGFVNFMVGKSESYKGNATFACEIVIGATWNKDLAYKMGKIVGENGLYGDENVSNLPYSGWYAPAVNLHRSPFSGRNFEYYSEDPAFSGKMAVNVINGAAQKGVYTDLKHFALNDQETNRAGVSTFCTEQALREIYLKPFEMAVKGYDNPLNVRTAADDGITEFCGTTGVMSSFNRIGTKWTGGDYRLLTKILRNEWGFKGVVICDYKTDNSFMNSKQMVYAGNDLILTSLTNLMWENPKEDNAQDVTILRQATKNILYAVANSNSIQIDIKGYATEWWKITIIAVDVLAGIALLFGVALIIKNRLKNQ